MTVLLEKPLLAPVDAFRAAQDGQGTPCQPGQRRPGDRLPVFRQHPLGHAGPELAFRVGYLHPGNGERRLSRRTCLHDAAGPQRSTDRRWLLGWRAQGRHGAMPPLAWSGRSRREGWSPKAGPGRIGVGQVADDLYRLLVLAETEVDRVPHASGTRPGSILHLGNQFLSDPSRIPSFRFGLI